MNPWFRVYSTLVDDPKVRKLPDNLVASLLWLWCIAGENNGVLPAIEDVAFKLRCAPSKAAEIITKLCSAGLIDNNNGTFAPHNWGTRQYKSDGSAERMRRHRSKGSDVTSTVTSDVTVSSPVTGPEQSRAEQSRAEQTRAVKNSGSGKASTQSLGQATASIQLDLVDKALRTDLRELLPSADLDRCAIWISKGYDPGMIREVVAELLARKPDIASLAYCDAAIAERHAKRAATPSERAAGLSEASMDWAVAHFAKGGHWPRSAGAEPGMHGCKASPELLAKYGLGKDGQKLRVDA